MDRTTSIYITCGLIAVAAGLDPVAAQNKSIGAMNPVNVQGISLGASGQTTYHDNLLRLSDFEQNNSPELKVSDWVHEVDGHLEVGKQFGRQQVSLSVAAGYVFHNENSQLDNDTLNAQSSLNWVLGSRCTGAFAGHWNRRQADFDSVEDIVSNTLSQKGISTFANCTILGRFSLAVGGAISDAKNSYEERKINDNESKAAYAAIRYSYRPESYLALSFNRSKSEYTDRPLIENVQPSFTATTYSGELHHTLGARLTLGVSAGAISVDSNAQGIGKNTGFSGDAEVSYDAGGRHLVSLHAFKDISPMNTLSALYAERNGIDGGITTKWTPSFTSSIGASYAKRKIVYDSEAPVGIEGQNRDDKTIQGDVGFSYDVGRMFTLSTGARYVKRNAEDDLFDYTDKSIFASLRITWN